jgi:tetratricopeptide (TPR) repeat protein
MKTNSRIFAVLVMITLMAMGFPQDLKRLSYLAYLDQDKNSWKSNVAVATKAYQSQPDTESKYQLALMEYGLLNATMKDQDEKLFDAYVDGLEERLEELSKDKTHSAEAKALLSSVYGFKIAYSPWKGMILGGKSSDLLEAAMKSAPNSPIVQKMYAGNQYFTPEMWGGDKDKALAAFLKSNQLFEQRSDTENWMYLDNLAWTGMLYQEKGMQAEAKKVWEKALAIEPNFEWVSKGLLPSLN